MAYTPDPTNSSQPLDTVAASTAAAEFRALKAYIQSIVVHGAAVAGGTNFARNPQFLINQRAFGAVVASADYFADGWKTGFGAGASAQCVRSFAYGDILVCAGQLLSTAANPTPGATQYAIMEQVIEGIDTGTLLWGTPNARSLTVSFTARANVNGEFSVCVRNLPALTRAHVKNFTLVAGIAKRVELTFPGCTDGAWSYGAEGSLDVVFAFASGSAGRTPAIDTWNVGTQFMGGSGNILATNGGSVAIGDVQYEVNDFATPFNARPYAVELARAERYYQLGGSDTRSFYSTAIGQTLFTPIVFRTAMRTVPNLTVLNLTGGSGYGAFTTNGINTFGFSIQFQTVAPIGVMGFTQNWAMSADI